MANISLTNSFTSFIIFIIVTVVYFLLKIFSKTDKMVMIWTIVYFLMVLSTQFFINVSVSKNLCGTNQYGTASIATFIPWVLMLGSIKILLTSFPGWLAPFSNTFGYIVTKLLGIGTLLNDILSNKFDKESASENMKIAAEALEHIYADKSLLINEITQQNFDTFWSRMSSSGLFKKNAGDYKDKLLNLVKIKDDVSEFIWYILTGGLVSSVSYSYIVNSACNRSVNEIEQNVNKAESTISNDQTEEKRVYKSFE
jgi:hypothetical protein